MKNDVQELERLQGLLKLSKQERKTKIQRSYLSEMTKEKLARS